MQRIHSPKLEAIALRSLTSADAKLTGWLYPRIGSDHFSYTPSQEFFRRIQFLTRKTGELPSWEDLLDDLAISEDTRDVMAKSNSGVIDNRKDARRLLEKLDEYRKARVFFGIQRPVDQAVDHDGFEAEAGGEL